MPQTEDRTAGWAWFDTGPEADGEAVAGAADELAKTAARCFRGRDGTGLLAHLRRATIERTIAPDAPEARLRHLEGQRHLVRYIEALVAAGGTQPQPVTDPEEPFHD